VGLLDTFRGALRGSINVHVDEELTRTDKLMVVWGPHTDTRGPGCVPPAVSQCGGDVTTERRVQLEQCVLGRTVVVLVMMGGLGGGGAPGLWPRPSSLWSHQL